MRIKCKMKVNIKSILIFFELYEWIPMSKCVLMCKKDDAYNDDVNKVMQTVNEIGDISYTITFSSMTPLLI